jgi:hypothetical protein
MASIYGDIERDLAAYNSRGCTGEKLCNNIFAFKQFATKMAPSGYMVDVIESIIAATDLRKMSRKHMKSSSRWKEFVKIELKVCVCVCVCVCVSMCVCDE